MEPEISRPPSAQAEERINGISVVVCTYNGVNRIGQTLERIFAQQMPLGVPYELVVVDNNSSDGTREYVEGVLTNSHSAWTCSVVTEMEQGIAAARTRAFSEVRHNVIVFVDDDNWLRSGYLQRGYDILRDR